MTTTKNTFSLLHKDASVNLLGRPIAGGWYIMYGDTIASYQNNASPILSESKADLLMEKLAAKRAAVTIAAAPVAEVAELATEAQIGYLTSLLPRFYAVQMEDGITMGAPFTADGSLDMIAIHSLTKREASAWISGAKEALA